MHFPFIVYRTQIIEDTFFLLSKDPIRGVQWKQENPITEVVGHRVYNRPVSFVLIM